MAEDLGARYDAVRQGGSGHVITSHAAISSILTTPHLGVGATDEPATGERRAAAPAPCGCQQAAGH